MNGFNPYSSFSSFSQDPFRRGGILGELPTSSITGPMGTTYGYGGQPQTAQQQRGPFSSSFGNQPMPTYQPSVRDLALSQKAELERLQGIQGLQTGAIQQQVSSMGLQEAQQMDLARRRIFSESLPSYQLNRQKAERGLGFVQQYVDPYYIDQAKREKELQDLQLEKARREAGMGGFQSWFTPTFPTMR